MAALAVRRGQGLRPLHDDQLPRVVRDARVEAASCSTTSRRAGGRSSSPARSEARRTDRRAAGGAHLGNLDARRDWGFAGDYVDAMWRMLQQPAARTTWSPPASRASGELLEAAFAAGRPRRLGRATSARPAVLPAGRGGPADGVADAGPGWCSAGARGRLPRPWSPDGRRRPGHRGCCDDAGAPLTRVLVTGATGQDGTLLVRRLLSEGADVHGMSMSGERPGVWSELGLDAAELHVADLADEAMVRAVVDEVAPDEIYNLGGQTSVGASWDDPRGNHSVHGPGRGRRPRCGAGRCNGAATVRSACVQASSAEIFGSARQIAANGDHADRARVPLWRGQGPAPTRWRRSTVPVVSLSPPAFFTTTSHRCARSHS